jgi:uncharacterized protein YjbJ (UPF0337 family)
MEHDDSKDQWLQAKSKIKGTWNKLTNDELERTKGNVSEITALILAKYNESKSDVVSKLMSIIHTTQDENDLDRDQDGIIVDSREPGSKEWTAREDINQRT